MLVAFAGCGSHGSGESVRVDHPVTTAEVASAIAATELIKKYGADAMVGGAPTSAKQYADYWAVDAELCARCGGGVAIVWIDRKTGNVIQVGRVTMRIVK